jgi:CRP/FNR family transcriptional regulator
MPVEKRLESQEIFGFLLPKQVDSISEAAEVVRFKANETVYAQGEPTDFIYVVLEGEVQLRLPGRGGINVPIDVVTAGAMFGSCMCFDIAQYSTTAQCIQESKLLKIRARAFSKLMDNDPRMGYALQRRISEIYFRRYLDTMHKLQTVVMSLPVEA